MYIVRIFLIVFSYYLISCKSDIINEQNNVQKKESSQNIKIYSVPSSFTFAGEPIPLDLPDVRERFDKELHVNSYLHSSTILLLKRARRWLPEISEILKSNDIPEDFKYLPVIESGLENVISYKRAVGFWQFLAATARENGLLVNNEIDERYDPIKSTYAAVKYLKKANKKFDNWVSSAASYNRGIRGIENSMRSQKVNDFFNLYLNNETTRYIYRILAIKAIFESPSKYGFNLDSLDYYYPEKIKEYKIYKSVPNLTNWSLTNGSNYKELKRYNPWLRKNSLTIRKNKSYIIYLPQ